MNADSRAVRRNFTKARHWFELAADQGNSDAQFWLDKLDEFGLGRGKH